MENHPKLFLVVQASPDYFSRFLSYNIGMDSCLNTLSYPTVPLSTQNQSSVKRAYLVGWSDATTGDLCSVHETYEGALKAWNEVRQELIVGLQESIKRFRAAKTHKIAHKQMIIEYEQEIECLKCEDPDLISNPWQPTPYLREMELKL